MHWILCENYFSFMPFEGIIKKITNFFYCRFGKSNYIIHHPMTDNKYQMLKINYHFSASETALKKTGMSFLGSCIPKVSIGMKPL